MLACWLWEKEQEGPKAKQEDCPTYGQLRVNFLVVHIAGDIQDLLVVALVSRGRGRRGAGRLQRGHGGEAAAFVGCSNWEGGSGVLEGSQRPQSRGRARAVEVQ